MPDDLENVIFRTVERALASRYHERHGLVTSYDKKRHLAKVKFMPEGQESGFIPIETNHITSGGGIAIGLTPGSGDGGGGQGGGGGMQGGSQGSGGLGSSGSGGGGDQQGQQYQGDQVIVHYHEGDIDSGKVAKVVHSDKDKPPPVESGEIVTWTKFKDQSDAHSPGSADKKSTGCKVYHKKDGSLTHEDGTGCVHTMNGKGSMTVSSGSDKNTTITHQIMDGKPQSPTDSLLENQQSSSSKPKQLHFSSLDKGKGATTSAFEGKHKTTWDQSGVSSTTEKDVTMTAKGKVSSKAPNIPHDGQVFNTMDVHTQGEDFAGLQGITSDRRLKTKIADASSMLDKIMSLKVKTFHKHFIEYGDDKPTISRRPPKPSIGLIAQELREVFPEAVHGDESKGYLSMDPAAISMALVTAFQEFVLEVRQKLDRIENDRRMA
jgi:hypothetical protein